MMDDKRRLHLNPSTLLLSVGLFSLGLSALGWVAMQWHEHLHKIDVEELTQVIRQECGKYAERQAIDQANQRRIAYPEAFKNSKEGWYSIADYDREYKKCVETTPPDRIQINLLMLSNPDLTPETRRMLVENLKRSFGHPADKR